LNFYSIILDQKILASLWVDCRKLSCFHSLHSSTGGDPASNFRGGDFSNIWQSRLIMRSLL